MISSQFCFFMATNIKQVNLGVNLFYGILKRWGTIFVWDRYWFILNNQFFVIIITVPGPRPIWILVVRFCRGCQCIISSYNVHVLADPSLPLFSSSSFSLVLPFNFSQKRVKKKQPHWSTNILTWLSGSHLRNNWSLIASINSERTVSLFQRVGCKLLCRNT